MKSENLLILESFFKNPLQFLVLEEPQVHKNMTVIPIVLKDNKFVDFITIQEAELFMEESKIVPFGNLSCSQLKGKERFLIKKQLQMFKKDM
ncbi:MAG: hypothetical protein ACTSSM_09510 [Promethearchaeota archaeon]